MRLNNTHWRRWVYCLTATLFFNAGLAQDSLAVEINIGINNSVNTGTITGGDCYKGNGKITSQQRQISEFTELEIDGVFEVKISSGKKASLQLSADGNLLKFIETTVTDGKLLLTSSGSYCTTNAFVVEVTTPALGGIFADGASDIVADLNASKMHSLDVHLRGTTTLQVAGESDNMNIQLYDTAELDATRLKAGSVHVEAGDATVGRLLVTHKLTGVSRDASEIHYMGSPGIIKVQAEDAGEFVPSE